MRSDSQGLFLWNLEFQGNNYLETYTLRFILQTKL